MAKKHYVRAINVHIRAKVAAASGVNPRRIYILAVGDAYNDVNSRQASPAEDPTTEQWGRKQEPITSLREHASKTAGPATPACPRPAISKFHEELKINLRCHIHTFSEPKHVDILELHYF